MLMTLGESISKDWTVNSAELNVSYTHRKDYGLLYNSTDKIWSYVREHKEMCIEQKFQGPKNLKSTENLESTKNLELYSISQTLDEMLIQAQSIPQKYIKFASVFSKEKAEKLPIKRRPYVSWT
ncbi:hypothetical protein BB560_006180 [Smittium megazygosporum]|uniref:Uncharacterized protein n=1 Tax=Smittium megazygosporum TaxID=133381 RepID=A0A2T9YEL1_9FUNG|nr:hypothetical protein BB560_006180 [Smittium megazygosporum]